ncbi:HAD family hydrolase [Streptomyces sp. 142MFCol3.1]|uniref:HAD family hydrolase n=1 Tax=Streptomyces sp. 142MFCol3.1 TaxID=1172179 RepID=UPI000409B9E5|nr:HAD hydrolase-like protein [Streptomyces sp. 142MFCol3.1]
MVRSSRVVLVTDLDNTLYDFAAYYEAGISALVAELEARLAIDSSTVTEKLRDVFTRHGSIEYPFAVEELPEVLELPRASRREVTRACLKAFWDAGSATIHPYPTVLRTLGHLQQENVAIIGHTDAPIHEVLRRLRHLKLDRYLTGIVAQQWFRRRPRSSQAVYLTEVPGWSRPSRRFRPLWRIPVADLKPNAVMYRRIIDDFGVAPRYVTVIGDSVARDLVPAVEAGCAAVWARYGRRSGVGGLMAEVVPHILPEVGMAEPADTSAIRRVDSFEGVLAYMATQQVIDLSSEMP